MEQTLVRDSRANDLDLVGVADGQPGVGSISFGPKGGNAEYQLNPEQRLWLWVIMSSLRTVEEARHTQKNSVRKDAVDVWDWIEERGGTFELACSVLKISPSYLRRAFAKSPRYPKRHTIARMVRKTDRKAHNKKRRRLKNLPPEIDIE